MNRFKIAQPIALVATVLSVIGFIIGRETEKGLFLMMLGMTIGIVSYLFGGLLTAARMAGSIAKWGWLLTPFPYALLTGAFAFVATIVVFFFIPIIPVRKAYKESGYY